MTRSDTYSLMVHGGAGTLDNISDEATATRYLDSIRCVLEAGGCLLRDGAPALQVVESCAVLLEDDPLFNAGRGSVLNEDGRIEMDAAIMDGRDLSAGAVAAVQGIANPVRLARRVLEESEHVLLIAEGALRFAERCGMECVGQDWFLTADRVEQYERARRLHRMMLDHDAEPDDAEDHKYGTIGVIARDAKLCDAFAERWEVLRAEAEASANA